jgi:hypothetical protein
MRYFVSVVKPFQALKLSQLFEVSLTENCDFKRDTSLSVNEMNFQVRPQANTCSMAFRSSQGSKSQVQKIQKLVEL